MDRVESATFVNKFNFVVSVKHNTVSPSSIIVLFTSELIFSSPILTGHLV